MRRLEYFDMSAFAEVSVDQLVVIYEGISPLTHSADCLPWQQPREA